jgi:hypothetical protein
LQHKNAASQYFSRIELIPGLAGAGLPTLNPNEEAAGWHKATPIRPPISVPLKRIYCRSRPTFVSMERQHRDHAGVDFVAQDFIVSRQRTWERRDDPPRAATLLPRRPNASPNAAIQTGNAPAVDAFAWKRL